MEESENPSGRLWSTLSGLLLAGGMVALTWYSGFTEAQSWTAAVTTLCAMWWIFEALPLAATALVPLVVFPVTNVLSEKEVAAAYCDPYVLLFMAGFMLSQAVEYWGAHHGIARAILDIVGSASGRRLVLAFMIATALLSMWISNTAAALMMLPVALSVIDEDKSGKLGMPLMLGIAYAASIGGIATPIGTPPNGVFVKAYMLSTGLTIPFHQWLALGGIIAVLMLIATWLVLTWKLSDVPPIRTEMHGEWTTPQLRTLAIFGLAALAWVTREIPFGGWKTWLHVEKATDTTVAIAAVLALFLIPSGQKDGKQLLDWPTAVKIPWGVLFLFGGGIAIAGAFESSGLSEMVGQLVVGLRDWPPLAVIGMVCLAVTFLSEVTSNTATSNILMPILAATAKAGGMNPAMLMFPATLSNSLSFMLPVGTPPNAIAFGTGKVRIAEMVRIGFVLNLIGVAIVTLVCWKLLPVIVGG